MADFQITYLLYFPKSIYCLVVGTSRVRELERRVREVERLLGRKTMEVEILKEALDVARVKKPSLQLPSWNDRKDGSP